MTPLFKYTGDQTVVYTNLKNRNGTTVKAEPGKVFDLQALPTTKDANGVDVPIAEFVQLTEEQADAERAGEDTTGTDGGYVAPSGDAPSGDFAPSTDSGGTTTPPNADTPAGSTPEGILEAAKAEAEALLKAAETDAENIATEDVEPFLKAAEAKAEGIINDAKTKIEELFGHGG